MGTEYSVHNDFELEEPIPSSNEAWELFAGQKKQSKAKVTVFVRAKNKQERKEKSKSSSQKYLKVLRHPAILKYHASYEDSSEIYLITEPVVPVEAVIEVLDVREIVAGLFCIVQALDFLHDKCGLSHNDVSLSSVYISSIDGAWKLGGMEHVCKYSEVTAQFLETTREARDTKSISPEEKENKVQLSTEIGHSLDSYAFGILVGDILDYRMDLGKAGEKFGEKMQSLFLHVDPKMRPKLSSLLDDEFFRNPFLEVLTFLNNITIKSDIDKEKFFSTLVLKLESFPPELVAKRLLLRLLSRFVLAEPSAIRDFLPHILTPAPDSDELNEKLKGVNPILPENIFKESAVPILLKLFSVKDTHVRLILLQFFGLFVKSFEDEDLKDFILPQLLLGLRDTDDGIVAATLQALSVLVPVLGGAVVVGGKREKLFIEGRPKFSVATTIHQDVSIMNLALDEPRKVNNAPPRSLSPETVSDVINLENRFSPTNERPAQPNKEQRQIDREQRRREMERKREERKREREMQKLERENMKTAVAKEKDVATDIDTHNEETRSESDNDDFEAWEDFGGSGSLTGSLHDTSDHTRFDVADLDFTQTHGHNTQSSFSVDQHGSLSGNTSEKDKLEPHRTTVTSSETQPVSWGNESSDTNSSISNKSSTHLAPRPSGKALKLGEKKTVKAIDKASKKAGSDTVLLGSEFEIPVVAVKSSIPDFFADMAPTINFTTHDMPGHRNTGFNDKLAVVNETSQVESGWDEDAWDDFN